LLVCPGGSEVVLMVGPLAELDDLRWGTAGAQDDAKLRATFTSNERDTRRSEPVSAPDLHPDNLSRESFTDRQPG
jgi:hypothetical protein